VISFPTFFPDRARAPGDDATRHGDARRARETSRQRAFSTDLAFIDVVSRRACAVRAWRARTSRDRIRLRVKPRATVPNSRRRARGGEAFVVDDLTGFCIAFGARVARARRRFCVVLTGVYRHVRGGYVWM
jgi:hypothetical protein